MPTIALADDHVLLRKGLASLVQNLGYTVILEVDNGQELIDKLQAGAEPDLVLMDINMPIKDGYEATRWIKDNQPLIKVLALSMYDDEKAILKMLKSGARGYILKDSEPGELRMALDAVVQKGYYYSELVTGKLIHSINASDDEANGDGLSKLTDREVDFLKLACSELTYKEIASQMHLSPRTIDGYRDSLFEKLEIKTRTGLAIYAIKNGLVEV
jgi:DNA-binding NarL/FixJ family response regulator